MKTWLLFASAAALMLIATLSLFGVVGSVSAAAGLFSGLVVFWAFDVVETRIDKDQPEELAAFYHKFGFILWIVTGLISMFTGIGIGRLVYKFLSQLGALA